ncbi:MAG: hypothetical protein GX818_00615, partial [Tissierellia bacterium]|nr:hypothetical protein [Tissierellia bacterium]
MNKNEDFSFPLNKELLFTQIQRSNQEIMQIIRSQHGDVLLDLEGMGLNR